MRICCDIDGVLADVREYVTKYLPHDWKTYFTRTAEFPAIVPMQSLIQILKYSFTCDLRFVTGRPESNRNATTRWLLNVLGYDPHESLLMRSDNDLRSTCEIKMQWFRELKPALVIDDDPAIVKAATKEGFVVLQVHGFRLTEEDMIPTNYLEESESDSKSRTRI